MIFAKLDKNPWLAVYVYIQLYSAKNSFNSLRPDLYESMDQVITGIGDGLLPVRPWTRHVVDCIIKKNFSEKKNLQERQSKFHMQPFGNIVKNTVFETITLAFVFHSKTEIMRK